MFGKQLGRASLLGVFMFVAETGELLSQTQREPHPWEKSKVAQAEPPPNPCVGKLPDKSAAEILSCLTLKDKPASQRIRDLWRPDYNCSRLANMIRNFGWANHPDGKGKSASELYPEPSCELAAEVKSLLVQTWALADAELEKSLQENPQNSENASNDTQGDVEAEKKRQQLTDALQFDPTIPEWGLAAIDYGRQQEGLNDQEFEVCRTNRMTEYYYDVGPGDVPGMLNGINLRAARDSRFPRREIFWRNVADRWRRAGWACGRF